MGVFVRFERGGKGEVEEEGDWPENDGKILGSHEDKTCGGRR